MHQSQTSTASVVFMRSYNDTQRYSAKYIVSRRALSLYGLLCVLPNDPNPNRSFVNILSKLQNICIIPFHSVAG